VALDGSDRDWIATTAAELSASVGWLKIGLEAFTACGPSLVAEVADLGPRVFLDLKLHDIPNTVRQAAANCARCGAQMFNVHASGGRAMLEAAVEGARSEARGEIPRIIAVTVLTSLDSEGIAEVGYAGTPQDVVLRLARLAKICDLDGVVASAREAPVIRRELGSDFLVVTPGVRPRWAAANDQRRVVTPGQAISLGADVVVIGRPITRAASPAQAADRVLGEMREFVNRGE
jgi:orotidine-5'-phosphate decarboxylase